MPYLFGTECHCPPSPSDPVELTALLPDSELRDLVLGTLGVSAVNGEAVTGVPDFTELIGAVSLKGRFTPDSVQAEGQVPKGDRWQGQFTNTEGEVHPAHIYVDYPGRTAQMMNALFRRGREARGVLAVHLFPVETA